MYNVNVKEDVYCAALKTLYSTEKWLSVYGSTFEEFYNRESDYYGTCTYEGLCRELCVDRIWRVGVLECTTRKINDVYQGFHNFVYSTQELPFNKAVAAYYESSLEDYARPTVLDGENVSLTRKTCFVCYPPHMHLLSELDKKIVKLQIDINIAKEVK